MPGSLADALGSGVWKFARKAKMVTADLDADQDLAAYKQSLSVAREELGRIDTFMRSVNHNAMQIEPSTRARRAHLCAAISALEKLTEKLGTI